MIYDETDRAKVRNAVLLVAGLAWAGLIWTSGSSGGTHAQHHQGAVSVGAAANWLLMLAAMMAPILIQPIQFVRISGLARRRTRATILYVAGYIAVWMLAGALTLWAAAVLRSSGLPVAPVLFMAILWQCSPMKQTCLNRCHALPELAAFGRAADTGALAFGAIQGIWCVGSCWAWMLLPLLLPAAHLIAMAAVSVIVFCERLDDPAPVGWRWRGFGKASRIVAARVPSRKRRNTAF